MRPEGFFLGETRSTGLLEAASGAPLQRFHVEGHGYRLPDGRLRLDQAVTFEGKPPATRSWTLLAIDAHRYAGTLTDASGPVRAESHGELFHLTYPLKGLPFGRMEQWLYLQPDGRTVMNEAVVTVAGLPLRRVSERISHLP